MKRDGMTGCGVCVASLRCERREADPYGMTTKKKGRGEAKVRAVEISARLGGVRFGRM